MILKIDGTLESARERVMERLTLSHCNFRHGLCSVNIFRTFFIDVAIKEANTLRYLKVQSSLSISMSRTCGQKDFSLATDW